VLGVVAAFALAGLADLHQKFSILGEFQDLVVVVIARRRLRARLRAAIAADPDVPFVIDGDAMVRLRPVVALTGSAPMPNQIAILVKLENRRRRGAALRARRVCRG